MNTKKKPAPAKKRIEASSPANPAKGTEANDQFQLEAWPFYWLTRANGQYLTVMESALREVELDIPRWRVLMLLEGEDTRSVSYLANEAISKLSTMTRIVARMEEDGLVETRPRASDARVTEVTLTRNGRRARALAWQQANRIYKLAFRDLSPEAITALNESLSKVIANLRTLP